MKICTFIIAFLVLALSVMPCADNAEFMNAGKTQTELSKAKHQQENDHQDDCSPFCHCSCCAGFSINHNVASIVTVPLFSDCPLIGFLPSATIEVARSVWQPPRSC